MLNYLLERVRRMGAELTRVAVVRKRHHEVMFGLATKQSSVSRIMYIDIMARMVALLSVSGKDQRRIPRRPEFAIYHRNSSIVNICH